MSEMCKDAGFIIGTVANVIKIVRWVIPILLILYITFDLFKVVTTTPDDKAKREAFNKIIKRIIYAVIVFLVPTVINIVLLKIEPITRDGNGNITNTSTSYLGCWNYYYNK